MTAGHEIAPAQVRVQPGQIWEDLDPRRVGRQLKVLKVDDYQATCVVVSSSLSPPRTAPRRRGLSPREVRIALHRFRPATNGYRLAGPWSDQ